MADSHCCTAKPTQHYKAITFQLKKKKVYRVCHFSKHQPGLSFANRVFCAPLWTKKPAIQCCPPRSDHQQTPSCGNTTPKVRTQRFLSAHQGIRST